MNDGLLTNEKYEQKCRKIMDDNFFGVEEALRCLRLRYYWKQCLKFSKIPYSLSTLEELKDTHILVAVFPLSIMDMKRKDFFRIWFDYKDLSYWLSLKTQGEIILNNQNHLGWYLVCKNPEKYEFDIKKDEVVKVQTAAYTAIAYRLFNSKRIFKDTFYTSSSLLNGDVVIINNIASFGFIPCEKISKNMRPISFRKYDVF